MSWEAHDVVGGDTRRFKTRAAAVEWARGLGYGNINHVIFTELKKRPASKSPRHCRICGGPHVYKHGRM